MKEIEETFRTWDGVKLFYRAWLPSKPARKALLLFHRGHEHSARWRETVEALKLEDFAVFAWDARGHGRSPGERGSAESLSAIVEDVQAFVWYVSWKHRLLLQNMIVLAHSVGAVSVTAWVLDHTPPIRGLILATPAFRVKLYVPFAVPLLRLKQKLFGPGYVKSYVKSKVLTHDDEQASRYDADEFIFRQIAVNILLDLDDTSTRLLADAPAIRVPTLLLAAGHDMKVVQDTLGLSSITIAADTYTSVLPQLARQSAEDVAALIRPAGITASPRRGSACTRRSPSQLRTS